MALSRNVWEDISFIENLKISLDAITAREIVIGVNRRTPGLLTNDCIIGSLAVVKKQLRKSYARMTAIK
jgi:hypothetical protein